MSRLDDNEREALERALRAAVPPAPSTRGRALGAELRGRQLRRRRRGVALAAMVLTTIGAVIVAPSLTHRFNSSPTSPTVPPVGQCDGHGRATHSNLTVGDPLVLTMCSRKPGVTWYGAITAPRDPLTTGLHELLAPWKPAKLRACRTDPLANRFIFQVTYADKSVARVTGATGECQPHVNGRLSTTGTGKQLLTDIMAAYGEQYGAQFDTIPKRSDELTCPQDPLKPGQTDVDGDSAILPDTGIVMPLLPTRGLLCATEGAVPLDASKAAAIRVALQSVPGGPFECDLGNEPTYTVVLEDKTGTRRTVTSDGHRCGAIVTEFPHGVNGKPAGQLLRLLGQLSSSGGGG